MKQTWRYLGELWGGERLPYTVEWSADPTGEDVLWVDFKIWEVCADGDEGPLYDDPYATEPLRGMTDDYQRVTPMLTGFLKWDGCNEVDWADGGGHCCGIDHRGRHHSILAETLKAAANMMGHWDDGEPPATTLTYEAVS